MRTYELTCIFRTDEDNFTKGKELVKAEFERHAVKVSKETDMGARELAYEIKKETKGHYYFYEIEVLSEKVAEMDKHFQLETSFLKYLFVRKED
ncbi:MAG: 30S ribosomal protein S6 [Spirochaetales bacterium]|nr:30S ribosomal protein S6 [Spirochaetales bacterium]